jgi:hypothetical protein
MTVLQLRSFRNVVRCIAGNVPDYVPEFRVFLVAVLMASLGDLASTIYFMRLSGPESEWHPVIRCMSEQLGPILGPICGKAWQFLGLVVLTLLLRRQARLIFVLVAIAYVGAASYNLWTTGLLEP